MRTQSKPVIPSEAEESRGEFTGCAAGFLHFGRNDERVTPQGSQ